MSRPLSREARGPAGPTAGASPRRRLLRFTGWFFSLNVLVLMLASLRNLAVTEMPGGILAPIFTALMFVAHCSLLAFLPALLLVPLALLWPRARLVLPLATTLAAILLAVVLIDTVVFQQYRFHLNAEVFNLLFGGAAGEILVFPVAMYLQLALYVLAIFGIQALLARLVWRRIAAVPRGRLGYALAASLVLAFLMQGAIHAWADVTGYTPVTRQTRILLGYLPITAESRLRKLGVDVERADAALLAADGGSSLAYPLRSLTCEPPAAPLNLLFLVIDSWRRDALDEAVTPHISRLAPRSLNFTDHLAGGSATRTGIFSMFYGIPGTYWHAMLAEKRGPVLVSEMLRQNYEISIFASSKLVNPEFHRTAFVEVENLRLRSVGDDSAERDLDATEDLLVFLEQRSGERPFFSMLFLDAPHAYHVPDDFPQPFQPSLDKVNYFSLSNDFDPTPMRNRYLNCVRFNDDLIGRVLETLERNGLMENTAIVVTGDHGQEFNENGLNYWGHDGNFSGYQVDVPLLLYWPGREGATYTHRTSHYDLVPTLMDDLLGCTNEHEDYSVGHHLLRPGGREHLLLANFTDYAIVQPDRIVAVYPYGVEVLDPRYRPIPDAKLDKTVMLEALRQRGRFYK